MGGGERGRQAGRKNLSAAAIVPSQSRAVVALESLPTLQSFGNSDRQWKRGRNEWEGRVWVDED